jgi:hypothetical protein
MVEDPLAEGLLQSQYKAGDHIVVVVRDDKLEFDVQHRLPEGHEPQPALPAGGSDGGSEPNA